MIHGDLLNESSAKCYTKWVADSLLKDLRMYISQNYMTQSIDVVNVNDSVFIH